VTNNANIFFIYDPCEFKVKFEVANLRKPTQILLQICDRNENAVNQIQKTLKKATAKSGFSFFKI